MDFPSLDRARGWGPSPDPMGGSGTPPGCRIPPPAASSPSQGWPQPLWTWQSSRIPSWSPLARDEPTQSCLIPGPDCPWIVPGLSLPSRTLQSPQPSTPSLPTTWILGVNRSPPPPTWVWQPLSRPFGNFGNVLVFSLSFFGGGGLFFPQSGWQLPPWQPPQNSLPSLGNPKSLIPFPFLFSSTGQRHCPACCQPPRPQRGDTPIFWEGTPQI